MAQAADRMKRTRDGNIFSMIPFHNEITFTELG